VCYQGRGSPLILYNIRVCFLNACQGAKVSPDCLRDVHTRPAARHAVGLRVVFQKKQKRLQLKRFLQPEAWPDHEADGALEAAVRVEIKRRVRVTAGSQHSPTAAGRHVRARQPRLLAGKNRALVPEPAVVCQQVPADVRPDQHTIAPHSRLVSHAAETQQSAMLATIQAQRRPHMPLVSGRAQEGVQVGNLLFPRGLGTSWVHAMVKIAWLAKT